MKKKASILLLATAIAAGTVLHLSSFFEKSKTSMTKPSELIAQKSAEEDSLQITNEDALINNIDLHNISSLENQRNVNQFPKYISVEFPTGDILEIKYDDTELSLPQLTLSNIGQYISELKVVAEAGSGDAAELIFDYLDRCSYSSRSLTEFQSRFRQLVDTGHYRYGSGEKETWQLRVGSPAFNAAVDESKLFYRLCKDIPEAEIVSREVWQEKALALGAYGAVTRTAAVTESPDERYALYKRAWDEGHIGVGTAIGFAYRDGNTGLPEKLPDLVSAYAYTLAQNKIIEGFVNQSAFSEAPRLLEALSTSSQYASANLTANEHLEAEKLAVELIRNNKACCKGPWQSYDR